MDASQYQKLSKRTRAPVPQELITAENMEILRAVVGIAGEGGELADFIKKGIYHQHGISDPISRQHIRKEIGDLLWYICDLCTTLGFDLSEVMLENVAKLEAFYPEGFDPEISKNRGKQ